MATRKGQPKVNLGKKETAVEGYTRVTKHGVEHVRPHSRTVDFTMLAQEAARLDRMLAQPPALVSPEDRKKWAARRREIAGEFRGAAESQEGLVAARRRARIGALKSGVHVDDARRIAGEITATDPETGWTGQDEFDLQRARKRMNEARGPQAAQSAQRRVDELETKKAAAKPASDSGANAVDRAAQATESSADVQKSKARKAKEARGWTPTLGVDHFGSGNVQSHELHLLTDAELAEHERLTREAPSGTTTSLDGKARIDRGKVKANTLRGINTEKAKRNARKAKAAPTTTVLKKSNKGRFALEENSDGTYVVRDTVTGEAMPDAQSTGASGSKMRSKVKAEERFAAWAYQEILPGGYGTKADQAKAAGGIEATPEESTPSPASITRKAARERKKKMERSTTQGKEKVKKKYRIHDRLSTQSHDLARVNTMSSGGRFMILDENGQMVDDASTRHEARMAVQMLKAQDEVAAQQPSSFAEADARSRSNRLEELKSRALFGDVDAQEEYSRLLHEPGPIRVGMKFREPGVTSTGGKDIFAAAPTDIWEVLGEPDEDGRVRARSPYGDVTTIRVFELLNNMDPVASDGGVSQPGTTAPLMPPGFEMKPFINDRVGTYSEGYRTEQQGYVVTGPDRPGGTIYPTKEEAMAAAAKRHERHEAAEPIRAQIEARNALLKSVEVSIPLNPVSHQELTYHMEVMATDEGRPGFVNPMAGIRVVGGRRDPKTGRIKGAKLVGTAADVQRAVRDFAEGRGGVEADNRDYGTGSVVTDAKRRLKAINKLKGQMEQALREIADPSERPADAAGSRGGARSSALSSGTVIKPQEGRMPSTSKAASAQTQASLDLVRRGVVTQPGDAPTRKTRVTRAASGATGGATKPYNQLSDKALRRRSAAGDSAAQAELNSRKKK